MTTVHSSPTTSADLDVLHPSHFAYRHIGPRREDVAEMIETLGYPSVDAFIDAVVPSEIRLRRRWRCRPAAASARSCRRSVGWPG
jgi:glycine dehydrogenase